MGGSQLISVVCTSCGTEYSADKLMGFCTICGKVLYCVYDIKQAQASLTPQIVAQRGRGIWRWQELLPVRDAANFVSLGEGSTPLLACARLGDQLGGGSIMLKDESYNPTASLRARGLAVAAAVGREYGIEAMSVPSLGDVGDALAAYAARAGLKAYTFVPHDASTIHLAIEVACGAYTYRISRTEMEGNQLVRALGQRFGWFDVSSMREPYRIEGEKTLGYELAEDYEYNLPDALIYPLGSVMGLAAIWKGWAELEALGWLSSHRPRIYGIQTDACAPLAEAFKNGGEESKPWDLGIDTRYPPLRLRRTLGDYLVLKLVRESGGQIISVSEDDIAAAQLELARSEGIFAGPEGALAVAGLKQLRQDGIISAAASVVIINPTAGMKEPQVVNLDDLPPVQAG
ncbi:MAG: threonine synthase [Candidatus Chloroheliales bacterium]|nr:MAG: threonine synthase [Chloroflexota bacterium]